MRKIEELEAKMKEIQEELALIKAQKKEELEETKSMLPMEGAWCIGADWSDILKMDMVGVAAMDQNVFSTEESAEAYRDAFSVMLELRRQSGSGAQRVGFVINDAGCTQHVVTNMCFALCPPFPTEELAEAARDAVGRDRIIAAYKTLTGDFSKESPITNAQGVVR